MTATTVQDRVLALLRKAHRDLSRLLCGRAPANWEEDVDALHALEAIASDVVEAVRLQAEHLSRQAGKRRKIP